MTDELNAKDTLYALRTRVDAAVEENFGYCPTSKLFDKLLDKMHDAEDVLRKINPEAYAEYSSKYY
jgi:hypothetical protein